MKTSLCTCGHSAHIFACWGDNGECACREHAAATSASPQPRHYEHMQAPVWPYRTFRRVGVSEWLCPDCEKTISADKPSDLLHLPCHKGYVAEPVRKVDAEPLCDLCGIRERWHGPGMHQFESVSPRTAHSSVQKVDATATGFDLLSREPDHICRRCLLGVDNNEDGDCIVCQGLSSAKVLLLRGAASKLYNAIRAVLSIPCNAQNGDSNFFCNLPKGHAADHQSVNLSGNGGSVGWTNRR